MSPTCSYYQCKAMTGQKSMFRFPTGDSARLQTWIDNCGNIMTIAHLSRDALRHKYICIDHFEKRFIQQEDGKHKRLNKLAVPVHYKGDQSTENFPDSPVASTSEGQGPTELKVLTPKKFTLVLKIKKKMRRKAIYMTQKYLRHRKNASD
ncbi:uncharacterized protein LOC134755492 [Cydia strobilella]|uniref:uncharacterized protein LOC134755121 n=1 Tax=Cydia strobilella TaxID=1100964 RepID=UPI003006B15B